MVKQKQVKQLLYDKTLDIIAITESKRNTDHPVIELHRDYKWIGKDRVNGIGGGVGFLLNSKSISVNDDNLLGSKTDTLERLWISVRSAYTTIAIGVVYFPVDNKPEKYDDAQKLQDELVQNIGNLQNTYDKIILVGDFNGKIRQFRAPKKQSSNGDLLEDLVDITDMIILNTDEKCTGEVTWNRGPLKSVIDYALCSSAMYDTIESMCIDEEQHYSIGSDHNFFIIKAHLPGKTSKASRPQPKCNKVNTWNIKDNTNWSNFETAVNKCFSDWNSDVYTNIDLMWDDFKSRLLHAGSQAIGYKSYSDKRDYWDKEIGNLIHNRKQANRLYRIWSKLPSCSPELLNILWEDYLEKKRLVTNRIKQNMITHKIKMITENASKASNNPRSYWKMLKKLNKSNEYPLRIRDPDDPNIIIDDPIKIKEILTNYWSNIGRSENVTQSDMKDRLALLQTSAPDPGAFTTVIFNETTIKIAIKKLKNGKATGTDGIPSEFLKNGGQTIQGILLELFQKAQLLEALPNQWYEGIVKPLHKDGNREVLNNYRGITISSVVYKVIVSIMENQVMDFAEANDLFGDNHGAFRRGRRCEDHIFSLKGICALRKSKKKKTFLAFLDISKAFDTIDRTTLFNFIWDKGIQGKAWHMIHLLYKNVDNRVIFGEYESDMYQVINGLKQGCVLSPCLFNLVMTDLELMLSSCNGVEINEHKVHGLFYADDIVLFADNDGDLLNMLDMAFKFSQKWNLKFN